MVRAQNALVVDVDIESLGKRGAADPCAALAGRGDEQVGAVVTEVAERRGKRQRSAGAVVGAEEDRDAPVR